MIIRVRHDETLDSGLNPDYSERMSESISKRLPAFVSSRSGGRSVISGPPGSGKTYLLNALFSKKPKILRGVFHRIYYVVPQVSFESLERSPFIQLQEHGRVYHDIMQLTDIIPLLEENKRNDMESCLIIDDFGDEFNNREVQNLINRIFIKSRHYRTQIYLLSQTAMQLPKELRRLVTVWHLYQYPRDDYYNIMNQILGRHPAEYWDQIYDYVYSQPHRFMTIQTEYNPPKFYVDGHELLLDDNNDADDESADIES